MKKFCAALLTITFATLCAAECVLSADGKTVVGVKDKTLVSCTVPAGVTIIGKNAFKDCAKLQKITLPDSVTEIRSYAFANCASLTSFRIPPKVKEIGERAFSQCGLTSVVIPDGVTLIDINAFWGCQALKKVTIPDSVEEICYGAFWSCTSLKEVSLPPNAEVDYYAFPYHCKQTVRK